MNPLHKGPSFLMDLFRLRSQGKQPDQFGTAVQPVVDVHAMYSSDMLLSSINSVTAAMNLTVSTTGFGTASRLVGAAGRCLVGANAGTRINGTIGIITPSLASGAFFPLFTQFYPSGSTFAAMEFWVGGKLPGGPLVVPPGTIVQFRVIGNQTGSDHIGSVCLLFEDPTRG